MTAPELMFEHPNDQTLAAFIDDRLGAAEKRDVTRHIAQCGECRTTVLEIHDLQAMDEAAEDNVIRMRPKRGGWRVAAASIAVAAGLLVVFGGTIYDVVWGASMNDLVRASEGLKTRPGPGRFAAPFPYAEAKRVNRAAEVDDSPDLKNLPRELVNEVADLQTAPWASARARGVGYALAGYHDEAITTLRDAAKTSEEAKVDLAAALIARGGSKDLQEALDLSTGTTPAAIWNRAAAYHQRNDYKEAKAAWEAYLTVDRESRYADEALKKIKQLGELEALRRVTN